MRIPGTNILEFFVGPYRFRRRLRRFWKLEGRLRKADHQLKSAACDLHEEFQKMVKADNMTVVEQHDGFVIFVGIAHRPLNEQMREYSESGYTADTLFIDYLEAGPRMVAAHRAGVGVNRFWELWSGGRARGTLAFRPAGRSAAEWLDLVHDYRSVVRDTEPELMGPPRYDNVAPIGKDG